MRKASGGEQSWWVWYIIGVVGIISAIGIWLYGRWVLTLEKPKG